MRRHPHVPRQEKHLHLFSITGDTENWGTSQDQGEGALPACTLRWHDACYSVTSLCRALWHRMFTATGRLAM